jgi:hypothetical protein
MNERVRTWHPDPQKKGVSINKDKYEIIRAVIFHSLKENKEMSFRELIDDVELKLTGNFDGSIPWYVTTVKLDLEARKIIERIPKSNPQKLRLIKT